VITSRWGRCFAFDSARGCVSREARFLPRPNIPRMTQPSASESRFHLRIDAHALVQLGEQLITDDEQALLELAKNSYDADAQYAKIKIQTDYVPCPADKVPVEAVGLIEIEDNGVGMDERELREGWLMISLSLKRDKANRKPSAKFKRYPLGDKGLGRLGTMKLGKYLSVETRKSTTEQGWRVTFQWSDIRSGQPLEHVPIDVERVPASGQTGTVVRIYGLFDRAGWRQAMRQDRVEKRLAGLISPFTPASYFDVAVTIDGQPLNFVRVSEKLRETATVSFDYRWEQGELVVSAKVKLIWFRKKRVEAYNAFVAADRGATLAEYLRKHSGLAKAYNLEVPAEGPWYLKFSQRYQAKDLFSTHEDDADPGPFHGVIDYFDLDTDIEVPQFMTSAAEYRTLVKRLAQIYVYRDGFGIRMHRDWLDLGGAWTSQRGFYSLKPKNVIGFFQLSVEKNPDLVEKSDREGFTNNPAWRGFERLAQMIAHGYANYLLNTLGKTSVDYLKERLGEHPMEDEQHDYGELLKKLEALLVAASDFKQEMEKGAQARVLALRAVEGTARSISLDRKLPEEVRQRAGQLVKSVEANQATLAKGDAVAADFAQRLVQERPLAAHLRKRIDDFDERAETLYEMVAVGLSAQALAHDVPGVLANTEEHLKALVKLARSGVVEKEPFTLQSQHVGEGIEAVRQMLLLVQPMLRGKRMTRRQAKLSEFVRTFFEQRGPRLKTNGVVWSVEPEGMADFVISFNPGRFLQIIDNLATNSEYWIEHLYGAGHKEGKIFVLVRDPELIFWDNGPGVREDLEDSLFQMFESGKPRREGNGLGLFIAQQLLLREGCSISLDEDRNRHGRRFRFVIDFSGVKSAKP